jgi:uncharacterized protein YndB with AHSA1/START domain
MTNENRAKGKRRKVLKIVGAIVGALVLVGGGVTVWGAALPEAHVVSRTVTVGAPPSRIFARLADMGSWPEWNHVVKAVRTPPRPDGRTVFLVKDLNGETPMEIIEKVPDRRVVTRIVDEGLPFGGTWTWDLEREGGGTRVSVVERGRVYNPFFRFMARYVFGHYRTMDAYLHEVRQTFGEAPTDGAARAAAQ